MPIPLFEQFPTLQQALHYEPLAELPTPVHPLKHIGHDNAWIKRDDLTHCEYGGNKVRKLEFVLPEILRNRKRHVITFGAIGTNAGVATAMMCAKHNLRCTIYLFDQPLSDTVKQNLALMQYYGARLIYKGSLFHAALAFYLSPFRLSKESYFLFAGCSNPVATFAYINAAYELKNQIETGQCPEPETIHIPVGSSSSLAGLTLGAQLAGLESQIVGTRVAPSHVGPIPSCTPKTVNNMINSSRDIIQSHLDQRLPPAPNCILLDDQYGAGYGCSTTATDEAIQLMNQRESIPLEATYSAKAFTTFQAQLSATTQPTLFWNTFNSRKDSKQHREIQIENLPKSLQDIVIN